ncbi:hypothetical protein GIB67_011790 [Kingdonia uniflora]|uniref:FAS1 domain-containing protein n=1 Tax=Kingdonia uniflora TaxID=39325 RepID=A0A7J7NXT8_9MAGN|nr:hypothetical protein GIB67_011790 [Kingdonia uniflora]
MAQTLSSSSTYYHSNFTPTIFTILVLLLIQSPLSLSLNITALLSSYPDLSDFNNLLSSTSVAQDLTQRSSLTLLAVPNHFLRSTSSDLTHRSNIADVIRYHVLLQYFSSSEFRQIPFTGKLVTTLYQTTGRATKNLGAVNVTRDGNGTVYIRSPVSWSPLNVTVLSLVKTFPYNVSIYTVNSLLVPYGFDLMASENRPPLGLNISRVLVDGHNFNVAASMLVASGVTEEFEKDEAGAGITMFVPTDEAFNDLDERFQGLSADYKAVVLKFHVLHSYYPLGSLESIVNPVQPTLATEDKGAGRFTLNITRVNGSVAIDTGLVQASITQTVFDQNPVAIFAVPKVLLPKEIFGRESVVSSSGNANSNGNGASALAPGILLSPGNSPPGFDDTPSGVRESIRSNCCGYSFSMGVISPVLLCIGLYLLL